ncbi:Hypothetical protein R9X50_00122400 [Acrodontium crateriforme]|uniref:Polyprenal reductase n=1 Tax=Acrodontium crateriforme TaxID=150365 RepID=A0AAQ3LYZ0_9PEZI|nr:Hypothetical protein R9X50_00122400 [Acrodontium crateriforme]
MAYLAVVDCVATMDLIVWFRLAYLGAAFLVLLISLTPALSSRFLAYGPRAATPASSNKKPAGGQGRPKPSLFPKLLDSLATINVSHSWFASFYAVSVTLSLFWPGELAIGGPVFGFIAHAAGQRENSMTIRQVALVWALLLIQGSRRLYECLTFDSSSNSQMWVGHWILGLGFYFGTSMAIWIEGSPKLQAHTFTISDIAITSPNVRTFIGILLFILASGFQHDCHAYLASLKSKTSSKPKSKAPENEKSTSSQYKVPEHPAFTSLIAPHYTAECIIYAALALIATPTGAWLNWTIASALLFVAVNLGVTAAGTKIWYERTFGPEAVAKKWTLIPFVW